jgi:hypothetical protein
MTDNVDSRVQRRTMNRIQQEHVNTRAERSILSFPACYFWLYVYLMMLSVAQARMNSE